MHPSFESMTFRSAFTSAVVARLLFDRMIDEMVFPPCPIRLGHGESFAFRLSGSTMSESRGISACCNAENKAGTSFCGRGTNQLNYGNKYSNDNIDFGILQLKKLHSDEFLKAMFICDIISKTHYYLKIKMGIIISNLLCCFKSSFKLFNVLV